MAMISFDFFPHFDLPKHKALACSEGRNHVNGRFRPLLLVGAPRSLAVNGDHFPPRSGQRRNPGDETTLKLPGVERGENIAQVIMRRRSIAKGQKPAQKSELCFPEQRDVGDRFRPAQNREQTQQQHFAEWITNLASLTRM